MQSPLSQRNPISRKSKLKHKSPSSQKSYKSNKEYNPMRYEERKHIKNRNELQYNILNNEKYSRYLQLAKRKPVVLSDESTENEDSSSDGFPSPSPVRRDDYSSVIKRMRELEKRLKNKK